MSLGALFDKRYIFNSKVLFTTCGNVRYVNKVWGIKSSFFLYLFLFAFLRMRKLCIFIKMTYWFIARQYVKQKIYFIAWANYTTEVTKNISFPNNCVKVENISMTYHCDAKMTANNTIPKTTHSIPSSLSLIYPFSNSTCTFVICFGLFRNYVKTNLIWDQVYIYESNM